MSVRRLGVFGAQRSSRMVQWLKSSADGGPNRPYQMVLMDDQTVIVIPLSIPSNITYTAKTLGMKSQCVMYIDVF